MQGRTVLGAVVAAAGLPVAAVGAYQAALACASFLYRPRPRVATGPRVTVLVPAHDEEELIAQSVSSLRAQTYPTDRYEVVVIADNCTDDTAAQAEAAGARVLVRDVPDVRGKGQALRWALDRILAEDPPPDAVAIVDADSVAAPEFLSALVAPLEAGADAAQGESLLADDGTPPSVLRATAFLLVNHVRPAGRAVLGLPCHLAGNGILLRREVLLAHPWEAFTAAEDLEYAITLRLHGVRPAFAGGAILLSPTAPNAAAQRHQQLRWEGGKVHLARTWIPTLLRRAVSERRPLLLDLAFELAIPPLGLLAGAAGAGAATSSLLARTGAVPRWAAVPWAVGLGSIPVYVLLGLRAADAPPSSYRVLAHAPLFVLRKLPQLGRLLAFRADTWVRTERARADADDQPAL